MWVAYAWQGCYATALAAGDPVAYANPEEGRNSWVGLYGISADSDSPELALEFLDTKLAEATCSAAVTLFYYGCANGDVMAAIDDPVLIEAFGINDPSILESTNFTPLVTEEQRDGVDRHVGAGPGRVARTTRSASRTPMLGRRGTLPFLAGPPALWLALFFVVPVLLIAAFSLRAGSGAVGPSAPGSSRRSSTTSRSSARRPSSGCSGCPWPPPWASPRSRRSWPTRSPTSSPSAPAVARRCTSPCSWSRSP